MDPDSLAGLPTGYWLGGPKIKSLWEAKFSAPVQTGRGAHPASCTTGAGSLSWGQSGRGLMLATHPNLAPELKEE